MSPAEVLYKAAALLEESGWWDGKGAQSSANCADTAIQAVSLHVDPTTRLTRSTQDVLRRALGHRPIIEWNDEQPDGEVVIAKLREVADDLERAS